MSILITGGSGFFGRGFAKAALDAGHERVCIYSRGEYQQHLMREQFDNDSRLRFFIGDVRDADRLEQAMQGVSLVVHAAALKRIEVGHYNPDEMFKTNIDGTMNVIRASTRAGVPKVVGLSSDKAFQPVSPYGVSKAAGESALLSANHTRGIAGPRFSCVRYGNVWRSTGSIVPRWEALKHKGEVPVTDPDCTRFFMTRQQAVELVMNTADSMQGGELAIPDLPAFRIGDLAEAMGLRMRVIGLPAFEKMHESMDETRCSADARRMSQSELKEALAYVDA
jgi:FlaA1/EpsC-like NDP-sugar epimerase